MSLNPDNLADNQPDPEQPASEPTSEQQIATLQAELDDLQSRLLRVTADYQNFARRSQQNIVEARQQQLMEVARALLSVLDHFDRALEVDAQKVSAQSLLDGVQIVRNELTKTLEQFDIRRLPVKVGDPFDPAQHEAMMRQPVEGLPADHIALLLQPGYSLGQRTLRPAKVAVTP